MAQVFRVAHDPKFDLSKVPTRVEIGMKKEEGLAKAAELAAKLDEFEDMLYFAGLNGVLIVLQGMDTSGKDGAIRFMLRHLNAQGVRVASFKVPTPEELSHDFLWRVHQQAPAKGEFVVFNRSHYEDVLVVRVHQLVKEAVWRGRYAHIRAFEDLLLDSGILVFKFFLHISKEEQEERLLAREEEVEKAWKLSVGDWKERERWAEYQAAYQDALRECGTERAPWHVIPADQKWHRDLAIAETLVAGIEPYVKSWHAHLEGIGEEAKAELKAFRTP